MDNVIKLFRDIFSMKFDVIIPISGNIIAIMVSFLLFSIRYFTYRHNQKKYEKRRQELYMAISAEEEDKDKEVKDS